VVVEGKEAGGHLGTDRSVEDIVPEVVAAVQIPVVAAGGIMDGTDAARLIRLGASGVQMATRFVASAECEAPPEFKQKYLSARKEDIVIIQSPVGLPGRAIRNEFTDSLVEGSCAPIEKCHRCLKHCSAKFCILDVLRKAVEGDTKNGLVFSGEHVHRLRQILPVREIMRRIAQELEVGLEAFPLARLRMSRPHGAPM
jgi:NAD(P)H-dependent flavin oxidoreductase YrpB (nitropropane dioxygenase family)